MPTIHPTLPADGDDAIVEPYNAAINLILSVLNGAIDIDNLADGAVGLAKLSSAVQGSLVPSASIIAFGGTTPPTGYLMCDGGSYLRGSYPSLFAALGTNYGSADGTHFNVPDLRGRSPVGTDNLGGSASNRIQRSTTLTTTSGSPTATVASATGLSIGMFITNANVAAGTTISAISGTTITMSANASGSGTTVAARFSMLGNDAQVPGAAGGVDVHTLVVSQLAPHIHGYQGYLAGSGGDYLTTPKTMATQSNAVAANSLATDSGSSVLGQAHPNMQPSVTTSFIIKT